MKPLLLKLRSGRAPAVERGSDDTLGRGMDLALTVLVFLVIGYVIDRWLGLFPVFTIALVVLAAVGAGVRMKYVYDATMERHEAQLRESRRGAARMEDAA
jgi:hypothetical protein